ncbi:unnamed protein product [Polarella glacialis]|uniref:Reverse transcriptase domain-containing protein n=1 Tax=Polarella glacialis TaxID=89957 RepID=A0A813IBX0_POLGL|nr:unnamed protein product [Polarella glacialis]
MELSVDPLQQPPHVSKKFVCFRIFSGPHYFWPALFLARRLLEQVWSRKDGQAIFLALDWAKAFDSVSPVGLLDALRRFGLPEKFLGVIKAIYSDRTFQVKDAGRRSTTHVQTFGICQGCTLSPFLSVMLMTVLMVDAKNKLHSNPDFSEQEPLLTRDLLYADDTLLFETNSRNVELFMNIIGDVGTQYGLAFNWSKLEAMPVRCNLILPTPQEGTVKLKEGIVYLGSLLSNDGSIGGELGRRIGNASCDFRVLCKVWSHAAINKQRKLEIFNACVVSKLMYCIHTAWLNVAERRRLDAFQNKCLRKVMGEEHSFYSRVTNQSILQQAGSQKLSDIY